MALGIVKQIRQAVEQLNPAEVREEAEREVTIRLTATCPEAYTEIEDFLLPPSVSLARRAEVFDRVFRAEDPGAPKSGDIEIYEHGLSRPKGAFVFNPDKPHRLVSEILEQRPDFSLALARMFQAFHPTVTDSIIFRVSEENALFCIATALPDIAPGFAIPWASPQAMSDTAVLSVNQIRMAFLLAAASGRPIGYGEQKTEVAGIVASAFGWRALARELVAKIPLGGGVIPKAGIAFAATYAEGRSLERLYRIGYGATAEERKAAYEDALDRGKQVARALYDRLMPGRAGNGG
jgi:uncharacterized protein (DUF697 family)